MPQRHLYREQTGTLTLAGGLASRTPPMPASPVSATAAGIETRTS